MRTLLVLRHGKSPHPEGVPDHRRPLADKAAKQIGRLAAALAAEGIFPDLVLSSDAVRAAASADAYARHAPAPEPLLLRDLYMADAEEILALIKAHGTHARALLVVGHNPGLEDFCDRIGRQPLPVEQLRTGMLVVFTADIDAWGSLSFGTAELARTVDSH